MKKYCILFAILPIASCVAPPPVVSDFNGDSVKVVTMALTSSAPTPESSAEATRICTTGGKQRAEYASTRTNSQTYEATHLYLCL